MADAFIGMTVKVRLKPGAPVNTIAGRVASIYDQILILEHVVFPETGERLPSYDCPSYLIADLEVVDNNIYQPTFPSGASTLPLTIAPTIHTDPAILSYARPTSELPNSATTPIARSSLKPPSPLNELPADSNDGSVSGVPEMASDIVSQRHADRTRTSRKGKGWRSTPLLETTNHPVQETPIQQPRKLTKSARKKRSARKIVDHAGNPNGWATEDATDVQDLGDFDFEGNLSKFDKLAVFEQIRNDDTTADEDRLVSHNRARPGTYGGKNLHHTEMVLSPSLKTTEASDLDAFSELDVNDRGGRASRQSTRALERPRMSIQYSSGNLDDHGRVSRVGRSHPSASRPLNASIISSSSFNRSTSSLREAHAKLGVNQHCLRVRDGSSVCQSLEPDRLRQIEQEYSRRGISADALIEVTARAVAQALSKSATLAPVPLRRSSKSSPVPGQLSSNVAKPVIVIIAGNHSHGAKAIAAARHLLHRNYKLLLSLADLASPASWHASYKSQMQLLQSLGGRSKSDVRLDSWPAISAQLKRLRSPPALILDALLDGRPYGAIDDVASALEAREVIDWMNRSRAPVYSLECPGGYDAGTGETTVVEGEPLAVKPDRVLALGAAVSGVLEALVDGEQWQVSILDVGLQPIMAAAERVQFGAEWSVEVELASGGDGLGVE